MQKEALSFTSDADGTQLKGVIWAGEGEPVATVQIAHGMAEHCLRYERLAEALTGSGFEVWAYDHRGHGQSAPDGGLGDFCEAGWAGLVADVTQCARMIRDRRPGIPHFLFAHSMGSFAAQCFLLDHSDKVDGVILSGSSDLGVIAQLAAASPEAISFDTFNAAFEPIRTPFDWLSRDESEVDKYVADPLCGFEVAKASAASMIMGGMELNDVDRWSGIRNDLPLLILSGDKDPVGGNLMLLSGLVEKYKNAGVADIDTKFYEDGRHEMLNETNRDEVTADIISWLKKHST